MPLLAHPLRRLLCIVCLLLCSATAQSATITWLFWDFPPGTLVSGGQPSEGYIDAVIKMLTQAWPEAQHQLVTTSTDNALASLNRGVEACYVSAIMTPERERIYYMTQTLLVEPHSLIARAEIAGKLAKNAQAEVLPAQLFDRTDVAGVLAQNRSYSPLLDALLDKRASNASISRVRQVPGTSNILMMLASGRGDYTLEYGTSFQYQLTQHPRLSNSALVVLPIAGGRPVPVGIACPRTAWGRGVIQKADALLVKLARRPDYFDAWKRWQPAAMQKTMAPHISAFLRQRVLPTDPNKFGPPP